MGCPNLASNVSGDQNIIQDSTHLETIDHFFAPVSFDVISSLVSSYQRDLVRIEALSSFMSRPDSQSVLRHFVLGNKEDQQYTMDRHISGLFDTPGAIAHLAAEYWQQALEHTDVMDFMPQARRYEWHEQIKNPQGVLKRGSKTEYEVLPLPEFEESTVRATLIGLINNRATFFAERVDGVFRALSKTHVTNQPEGFFKRMILSGLICQFGTVEWATCGVIDDLRCIIARFMGRDEPGHGSTQTAVNHIRRQNGVWQELDGGALRMRVYNGVGTAHIEVHETIAAKLNAALAMLYPAAIPEKNRARKPKARKLKEFELMDKLLPFPVVDALSSLKPATELYKEGFQNRYRSIPNTLDFPRLEPQDKAVRQQVHNVLEAIGGVKEKHYWLFDYDPADVVGEIVCNGAIPDHVSHQFYPTPENLADEVIALASQDAAGDELWLEPSAGCGALATLVPGPSRLHCVEVNALHAQILKAKGMPTVFQDDFLLYAKGTDFRYDRIVMNPPFSQGRWQAHLEAAAGLLTEDGRLVAILPASAKGKTLVPGFIHEYSQTYANEFAGTSISVVIVTLVRESAGS